MNSSIRCEKSQKTCLYVSRYVAELEDKADLEEEEEKQLHETQMLSILLNLWVYLSSTTDIEDLSGVVSWDQQFFNEFNKVSFSEPLISRDNKCQILFLT